MDTRLANPATATLRNMVVKDGFDPNIRMEMHDEAEESTYSVESEANEAEKADDTMNGDVPDFTEDQPGPSRASNRTVEIQGFSPLPPRMVSTPDEDHSHFMEQTKNDILQNLNKVQDLCDDTMKEVQALKVKWSEAEAEKNTLKVKSLKIFPNTQYLLF